MRPFFECNNSYMDTAFPGVFTVREWAVVPTGTSAKMLTSDPGMLPAGDYFSPNPYGDVYQSTASAFWTDVPGQMYLEPVLEANKTYLVSAKVSGVSDVDVLLTTNCVIRVSDRSGKTVYGASGSVVPDLSGVYSLVPMPDGNGYALNTLPAGMVAVVRLHFLETRVFTRDTSAGPAAFVFSISAALQTAIAYNAPRSLASINKFQTPYPAVLPSEKRYFAAAYDKNAYSVTEWVVLQPPQAFVYPPRSSASAYLNPSAYSAPSVWTGLAYGSGAGLGPSVGPLSTYGLTTPAKSGYVDIYLAGLLGAFRLCLRAGKLQYPFYLNVGGGGALLPTPAPLADNSGLHTLTFDDPVDATGAATALVYPGFGSFSVPSGSMAVLRLQINASYFTSDPMMGQYRSQIQVFAYGVSGDGSSIVLQNIIQGAMTYPGGGVPGSLASMYTAVPSPLLVTPSAPITLTATSLPFTAFVSGGLPRKSCPLTWTSAEPSVVAALPSSGLLTPGSNLAGGSTSVTVTQAGPSGSSSGVAPVTFAVTVLPSAPRVVGIAVTPVSIHAGTGGAPVALSPQITPPEAAAVVPLFWSSSNTAVATVTQAGSVAFLSPGTATITVVACDGSNTTATVPVVVTIPVSSIVVSPAQIVASTPGVLAKPLTAAVGPATATNKGVKWASSNWMVASVDPASGVVTISGNGAAKLTATALDGSGAYASVPVTVALAVTRVSIAPATSLRAVAAGATVQLTATVFPAGARTPGVVWSSSDHSVATVDPNTGTVTAVGNGVAVINATAVDGNGAKATTAMTVAIPDISIAPATQSPLVLQTGQSTVASVVTAPVGTPAVAVTWSIDDPSVATVDPGSGKVTAVTTSGVAVLTATAVSVRNQSTGQLLTATFNVGVQAQPVLATSVAIVAPSLTSPGADTLQLANRQSATQLVAQLLPETVANKACTWTSSRPDVVAVVAQNNGATAMLNTLQAGGPVVVTVATNDGSGLTAAVNVTVTPAPTGLAVTPTTLTLRGLGATGAVAVAVQPAGAASIPVGWSSDNLQAATVDGTTGVITVTGAGTAHITAAATTSDGTKLTAFATVSAAVPILPTALTITPAAPPTVVLTDPAPVLALQFTPAHPDVKTVTWSSSATSVAVVTSPQGVLTLTGPGTATITASTTDGSNLSASATVTVVTRITSIAFSGGATVTLTALNALYVPPGVVVAPSNASNQTLAWTSSAPEVASVDFASGTINPVANGSATITARATDGGTAAASLEVIVSVPSGGGGGGGGGSGSGSGSGNKNGGSDNSGAGSEPSSGPATDRKAGLSLKVILSICGGVVLLCIFLAVLWKYRSHKNMKKM